MTKKVRGGRRAKKERERGGEGGEGEGKKNYLFIALFFIDYGFGIYRERQRVTFSGHIYQTDVI